MKGNARTKSTFTAVFINQLTNLTLVGFGDVIMNILILVMNILS